MAFEIRRWQDLTQDQIDWLGANPDTSDGVLATDFFVGSLERSHLEAIAILQEEHEVRTAQAIKWAIGQSCFHAFGFDLLSAVAATGSVQFIAVTALVADTLIPTGTKLVSEGGQVFVTTADVTFLHGTVLSPSVGVVAAVAGVDGNVPDGAIRTVAFAIAGVDGVTNAAPTQYGRPIEDEQARLLRFQRYIRTLPRGTPESIEFAILNTGIVPAAKVLEPWSLVPIPAGAPYAGLFYAYVDDGIGAPTLDPTVLDAVTKVVFGYLDGTGSRVPGWKAAGVKVALYPVARKNAKIRGSVKIPPSANSRWPTIQANLTLAAQNYFATLGIADRVSYNDLLIALSLSDPDLVSVGLLVWLEGDVQPAYGGVINATDLVIATSDTASNYGARAVLFVGPDLEANGKVVSYPEWILA